MYPPELTALLEGIPWFLDLKPQQMEQLTKIASICQLEVGQVLFQEGEKLKCMYVVLEGELSVETYISSHRSVRLLKAEPLDILGWSTLTPVVRQSLATARAAKPSLLVCFDSEALHQLCERDHDLGYIIMRRISNVVATWLIITRLQMLDAIAHTVPEDLQNQESLKTA